VLALSAIDCGYESRSGQTKEYKIGICCFSVKNASEYCVRVEQVS
jgi:hypothetical protein